MTRKVMVRATGVGLKYKRRLFSSRAFWSLADVSFEVHAGETLGVIGSNGSGKSTLLRLLAGIYEPDCGTIESFGNSASLLSLQVGFLPHLTGRENAFLSGMLLGLRRKLLAQRMDQIIEFSGLADFIDEPISTYSSGMRARLGFAVAIQSDPDVLLIDEVLGVGDEEFRVRSTQMMKDRISSNKTVVLVSHSMPTLRSLCQRMLWLDHGRARAIGEVDTVLDAYINASKTDS